MQKRIRDVKVDDENASKKVRNEDDDDHNSNMKIDDNNHDNDHDGNGNGNGYDDNDYDYGNDNGNGYDENGNGNDNDNDDQQNDVNDNENDAQVHTFALPPSNLTLHDLLRSVSFYGQNLFESKQIKTEFETVYKRIGESHGSSLYQRLKSCDALLSADFLTLLKFYFCSESPRGYNYDSETDANFVFLLKKGKLLPVLIFYRKNFITSDVIVTLKEMVHDDSASHKLSLIHISEPTRPY